MPCIWLVIELAYGAQESLVRGSPADVGWAFHGIIDKLRSLGQLPLVGNAKPLQAGYVVSGNASVMAGKAVDEPLGLRLPLRWLRSGGCVLGFRFGGNVLRFRDRGQDGFFVCPGCGRCGRGDGLMDRRREAPDVGARFFLVVPGYFCRRGFTFMPSRTFKRALVT